MSYHQTGQARTIVHHRVDGLGAFDITNTASTLMSGWQIETRFSSDNVVAATWPQLAAALGPWGLDALAWTRSGSGPFRHYVKVRLMRDMTASQLGGAIATVFGRFGGQGARGFTYRAPYITLPTRSGATGAPPPPSQPEPVQSTPCTNMGGRCYDFSRPPADLPAGRWVRGKCADVDGLQTRCFVPASAEDRRAGGSPPATPSDEIRMASPPIFGSGETPDPAKAFMVGGLVILGGVLVYVGWTQWKKRKGMQAAVTKTPVRALPRTTNRRRRRNGGDEPRRRFYLERVRLDSQGYDRHGRYWGVGRPLFQYDDGTPNGYMGEVRADDRRHAKELVRRRLSSYPFTVVFTR